MVEPETLAVIIKLVILDFYGVLYSNFDWKVVAERINRDEGKAQKFAHLKNLSNKGKLRNADFRKEVSKLAQDKRNAGRPAVLDTPHVNDGLISIVKDVFPNAEIALLSNGNRPDVIAQLKECGIYQDFDYVYTSSDMEFIKPQIGAYKTVFKDVGVEPEEAIIVDDSPNHTATTRSYGYNTIKFLGNQDLRQQLQEFASS